MTTGKERWCADVAPWDRFAVAFSPDGRTLAIAGGEYDRQTRRDVSGVSLRDPATGKEVGRCAWFGHQVFSMAFSPDGRTLATGDGDRTIALWEVITGRERRRLLGHRGAIRALSFSPDGRRLASASLDATALVWNLADPARPSR